MPWIDPGENWASAPKLGPRPDGEGSISAAFEIVDGWAEIGGRRMEDGDLDLREATMIEIEDSALSRCRILARPEAELRIRGSDLTDVDLSGCHLRAISRTQFSGCKLAGAEVTGSCRDVVFHHCRFSVSRFLSAQIERTAFVDSSLDEVEFFESNLTDVSFAGSTLHKLNLDRAGFERVDLRHAETVEFENFQTLTGCLATTAQAHELAFSLAHSLGLGLEQEDV